MSGQQFTHVRLISAEGFEFVVRDSCSACAEKGLRAFFGHSRPNDGPPGPLTGATAEPLLLMTRRGRLSPPQIDYRAACVSNTIKSMLTSGGESSASKVLSV